MTIIYLIKTRPPVSTMKLPQPPDKIIPLPVVMPENKITKDIIINTTIIPKSQPIDDHSFVESISHVFMNELKEQKKS